MSKLSLCDSGTPHLGLNVVAKLCRAVQTAYKSDLRLPDGTQINLLSFPKPCRVRQEDQVVILTYNLQNAGSPDLLQWSNVIEAFDPDLFLAQESCDPNRYRLPQGSDGLAAKAVWCPVPERATHVWGSAVYARGGKITPLRVDEALQVWLTGAEVEDCPALSGRRVRVFSLHAHRPYSATVMRMLDCIQATRDGTDLILGGDFNLTIGQRHHSERLDDGTPWETTQEERAILTRIRDEFGLVNCWQAANPGVPLAQTYRSSSEARPLGCTQCPPVRSHHYDGIFVPSTWDLPRCTVVNNEEWTGRNDVNRPPRSDHNPVVATVTVSRGR